MKIVIILLLVLLLGCQQAEVKDETEFCGISTFGGCPCIVSGCSGQVCQGKNEEKMVTTCEEKECYDSSAYSCECVENRCQWVIR